MTYLRVPPSPSTAAIVESIWVQESAGDAATTPYPPTRVIPTGFTDLAFYFRDPFFRIDAPVPEILPSVVTTGPLTTYSQFGAMGKTGIIIVRFRPGTAGAVMRCSMSDLRNRNVDLGSVLPASWVREVDERIRAATNLATRIAVIEEFIERISRPLRHEQFLAEFLRAVLDSAGAAPVRILARQMSVSVRHLERMCRDLIGLSPKVFSRIIRLQAALEMRTAGMQWASIAHAGGYQDQSHLCNESVLLSGLPPHTLHTRSRATRLARFFNHGPGMSRFCKTTYA